MEWTGISGFIPDFIPVGCALVRWSHLFLQSGIKSSSKFHQKSDYKPDFGPKFWILTWEGG